MSNPILISVQYVGGDLSLETDEKDSIEKTERKAGAHRSSCRENYAQLCHESCAVLSRQAEFVANL